MYVIIAGCGRVGSQLALQLAYQAHDVIVIDKDRLSFRRLGATFNGITLEGVAFDEELLREAGIDKADAFIAVTNFDNTNLMSAEIAKGIYNVPMVISRLYNPKGELTFFKMGVDYVCGTTLLADQIKEKLFQGEELIVQHERLDLGLQVIEFVVPAEADGRPSGDLTSGVSSMVIAILRGNTEIKADPDTPLRSGDHVLIVMRKEGWEILRACMGEEGLQSAVCRNYILPRSKEAAILAGLEEKKMKVIVGGCSAVGAHLAFLLDMEGHEVTIIEENPEKFKRLPSNYQGQIFEGQTHEEDTLRKAGIKDADAFVSVTKFDNQNLMATEVARHVFHVPRIIARLFNTDKEITYQQLGINYVCGTRLLAQTLFERITRPLLIRRASCFNNLYDLAELSCPASWHGKTVSEVAEKAGVKFVFIGRRSTGHLPGENFVLNAGDTIMVVGTPPRLQRIEKIIKRS